MARPLKTGQLRKNFIADITSAENLVAKVRPLANVHPGGPQRSLHVKHVYRVVELAFMGIVSEWEDFVEQTFIRYLSDGQSDSGYGAPHKSGESNDMQHSYSLLSQNANYDPTKHYLRFSDPGWTISQAEFFFTGGGPYASIRTHIARLREANLIRNRVAHSSAKCKSEFKTVALSYVNPSGTTLGQGYRVGSLMASRAIRHFGAAAHNVDYFKAFCDLYRKLADDICPV